jgi:hypothetical protein
MAQFPINLPILLPNPSLSSNQSYEVLEGSHQDEQSRPGSCDGSSGLWQELMRDVVALLTTTIIAVVKNSFRACPTKQSYTPRGQQWSAAGRVAQGMAPAGARAAKREVRVCARGCLSSHATRRSRLMATAIATCCTCVFATPHYRVRRRPKARTPCDSVPATPARRL